MGDEIKLNRLKTDKLSGLLSRKLHEISVESGYTVHVLEMEDVNFHFDSAVLLPDYGPDAPQPGTAAQNRITGIAVIYACIKQAEKSDYKQKILIAGHTDKKGGEWYNLTLSQKRSDNVYYFLKGERTHWVESCHEKHQVEDYQQILKWVSYNWKWDCDPGEKTNKKNSETHSATLKFQKRYNKEFVDLKTYKDKFSREFTKIDEDGEVGRQTWGAFYDMYSLELLTALGTNEDGVKVCQSKLNFVKKDVPHPAPTVGCGEYFPASKVKTEEENPIDRRVEILFFDESEEPELKCHPKRGICKHKICDLYNTEIYNRIPVPVDPLPLPSGIVVRVYLKFQYQMPDGTERPFPKDFPIIIRYQDGTTESMKLEKEDGQLFFQAPREKKSFTLEFKFSEDHYISTPPANLINTKPDELITTAKVMDKIKAGYRVFKLPTDWNIRTSDWTLTPKPANYDDSDKFFKNLDDLSITNIGSSAAPVSIVLNPHWQYLKFLYFDRWIKRKLSIPSIIVEGHLASSEPPGAPDTHSNWTTDPGACQCLPWIIQYDTSGTPQTRPNRNVLILFRTSANTYIESTGDSTNYSRRLVTKRSGSASTSPGDSTLVNEGESFDFDYDKAQAQRLAYYDLPVIWKSRTYFSRLSGGTGASAAKEGLFEDLAAEKTENSKPLIFSLDDIVLFEADSHGKLTGPLTWNKSTDRLAIFCNTFGQKNAAGVTDATNLSKYGVYKPDTSQKQSYLSQKVQMTVSRTDNLAYIGDYPDWTRVVIAKGSVFDVFDKRTPDGTSGVVGARAGVRWLNMTTSPNFVPFVNSSPAATGEMSTRPNAKVNPFCVIQTFYAQDHGKWWTSSRTDHRKIGRFDIILLRCCDTESTGTVEVGLCLNYFRFYFNFNPTFKAAFNKDNAVPLALSGNAARDWIDKAIKNLLKRWNGPDGGYNSGNTQIVPIDTTTNKSKFKLIWFAQNGSKSIAHYELGIFKGSPATVYVRGYMNATKGQGGLDKTANRKKSSGNFTFAHETGHAGSLNDEYIEGTTPLGLPAPTLYGFDCYTPGSPYYDDTTAMMKSNMQMRARYGWHVAEWLRGLENDLIEFEVDYNAHKYSLPHHRNAPGFTYVNWPLKESIDREVGAHGKFDVIFYPLGKDHYSVNVLPTLAKKPDIFDGIFVILVKMKFDFHINNKTNIHAFLKNIHGRINKKFNFIYFSSGKVEGKSYNRCLLHFSARYWANNYSKKDPSDTSEHIKIKMKAAGAAEWDTGGLLTSADKFLLNFPINVPHIFTQYFANMIGLTSSTMTTAASFKNIISGIMPDANVQNIS